TSVGTIEVASGTGGTKPGGGTCTTTCDNPTSSPQITGSINFNAQGISQVQMPAIDNCAGPGSSPVYTTAATMTANVTQYPVVGGVCSFGSSPISNAWTYTQSTGAFSAQGAICVKFAPGTYCLGTTKFSPATLQVTGQTVLKIDGQLTV